MKRQCLMGLFALFALLITMTSCGSGDAPPDGAVREWEQEQAWERQAEREEEERQERIAYEAEEAGAIDWEDAADHIGEYVTIFGTVEEVSQPGANGDPIFVDIGNAYPGDRVTGVCWSEYHSAFDDLFSYEGEPVLMEGTLYMNDGTPNIELTDSFQIKAL